MREDPTSYELGIPTSLKVIFAIITIAAVVAAVFAVLAFIWTIDINDDTNSIKSSLKHLNHGSSHRRYRNESCQNCSLLECVTPAAGFDRFDFCDPYTGIQGVFNPNNGCPYEFFTIFVPDVIDLVANDGSFRQRRGRLQLFVDPFTLTQPQGALGWLDHLKQFDTKVPATLLSRNGPRHKLFTNSNGEAYGIGVSPFESSFHLSKKGAIFSSTLVASQFSGLRNNPFPRSLVTNPLDDLRLATCGLATNAAAGTPLVLDMWQTELGVWALYEVLAIAQTPENFYAAFTSIKLVHKRKDPWEFNELGIEYDLESNTAKWYVDGRVVMKIDRPGFLPKNQKHVDHDILVVLYHGGTENIIRTTDWNVAIGCINMLDASDPNNKTSDTGLVRLAGGPNLRPNFYLKPSNFYDNQSLLKNRIFGEGGNATYEYLEVSVR